MNKTGTLGFVSTLGIAIGCSSAPVDSEKLERSQLALAQADPSPLGFEDPSLWHGPGSITSSTETTEGLASLAVRPRDWSLYTSVSFPYRGNVRQIALDLKLPLTQPNKYWFGAVQLYAECPSKDLYSFYVGQVELKSRPLGVFTTLSFDVSQHLAQLLSVGCSALKLKVALNVPGSPGVYLIDNLRMRTDLLLHYRFDEALSGETVFDSSGYDRHGTLVGAAALTPNGRNGSALSLEGATSYLELPNNLTEGIRHLTVAAWVNLARQDAWARLFDFGGSTGFIYLTPSTHYDRLRYSAFAGFGLEGTLHAPSLPVGAWKHVALTTTGRDYRLFIDGVEAANILTVPTSPADIGSNSGNWIGRSRFPDPLFAGRVDDFRIYDRVLNQKEIQLLADPQGDTLIWRFDEQSGQNVRDSSALALDGIASDGTSWVQGVIGNALKFDGLGGHVQLPVGVVQSCTDLTLSTWVNLRNNPPWNRIFDFGRPDFSSFMYLGSAGFGPNGQELRFGLITPVGVHDLGSPFVMPLNEWNHLAVVIRDSTATLFLNGRAATRQEGVTSNPSDMGSTVANFFGRSQFPDPPLDGLLDDFRLSCRAYDDQEIAQLAHLPAPAVLPNRRPVTGDIQHVHDPALIQSGVAYYLFSTGPGLLLRKSADLSNFTLQGSVFPQNPAWVVTRFGNIDSLWAPDISQFGGTHHLYYAASTFGSNRSCIGHATKADLASASPWTDHGPVICSNQDGTVDDWNAIDANLVLDAAGAPWLSFGSFWGGLKMIRLDASGNRADSALIDLARRPETAIEAPFIVYRAPYYYLFASFDFCCRGANSNYRQVVGRSTSVTGPYLDRTGLPMTEGGGTPLVEGNAHWRGPGHNAILSRGSEFFNVYHAYDALNGGVPTLRVSELVWQEGWPLSAEP